MDFTGKITRIKAIDVDDDPELVHYKLYAFDLDSETMLAEAIQYAGESNIVYNLYKGSLNNEKRVDCAISDCKFMFNRVVEAYYIQEHDGQQEEFEPVLYVIVRNDLSSMNCGKAEAHSGHAASKFVYKMLSNPRHYTSRTNALFDSWIREGDGFGTQINLEGGNEEFTLIANHLTSSRVEDKWNGVWGFITDTSYPYKNFITGYSETREEVTAFYLFGDNRNPEIRRIISPLKLKAQFYARKKEKRLKTCFSKRF